MRLPRISSLSLSQMMKAVAFAAVAFACVAPLLRNQQDVTGWTWRGMVAIATFGGVAIPLAWAGLAALLIRRGPWRDALIIRFLLSSASVALAFAGWSFLQHVPTASGDPVERPVRALMATLLSGIIGVLGAACIFLIRRLRRGDRGPSVGDAP